MSGHNNLRFAALADGARRGGRLGAADARASVHLTAAVGDTVTVHAPRGPERVEIIAVRYDELR